MPTYDEMMTADSFDDAEHRKEEREGLFGLSLSWLSGFY